MGNRILHVSLNTFRETVRNKILYAILAFALLLIGLSYFVADLSLGDFARIIANAGLACIHIFGVIMAVFLGITLVSHEVERKTVYIILSKPVRRWEFIVGKALGLCLTLALTTSVMAVTLFLVHAGYGGVPEPGILVASTGIWFELILITCLATFFSTFTTPVLSAIFTLSLFLIGHISGDLLAFGGRAASPVARWVSRVLYFVLPNLEIFNWKNEVAYGGTRSLPLLAGTIGYFLSYCAAVLFAACLLFSRKDFK